MSRGSERRVRERAVKAKRPNRCTHPAGHEWDPSPDGTKVRCNWCALTVPAVVGSDGLVRPAPGALT